MFVAKFQISKKPFLGRHFRSEWDRRLCEMKLSCYYETYFPWKHWPDYWKICCRRKFLCKIHNPSGFYHLKTGNDTILRQKFLMATKIRFLKSLSFEVVFCTLIWCNQTIARFCGRLWKQQHFNKIQKNGNSKLVKAFFQFSVRIKF